MVRVEPASTTMARYSHRGTVKIVETGLEYLCYDLR